MRREREERKGGAGAGAFLIPHNNTENEAILIDDERKKMKLDFLFYFINTLTGTRIVPVR